MAGLLDLPAAALTAIASCLGISDKKSLALTCSAMPAIIRPLWTALQVDLASQDLAPLSLIKFSGITTIVVVDSRTPLPILATSTQPAFQNEAYKEPSIMFLYTLPTLQRVFSVVSTVLAAAAATLDQAERRELSLRIAVPGTKTGGLLQMLIQSISPKQENDASKLTLTALSMLLAASCSLLPGSDEAGGINEAAASSIHSSNSFATGQTQAAALRGYIDKLISHPVFSNISSSNSTATAMPHSMFSRATSALDHIHHLSSGGSPYYPFTSVDAGWFIPDGCFTDIVTKGTVGWCEETPDDQFRLELYAQLHTLRLCVIEKDEEYHELNNEFATAVLKINALPMLRELHLCRTEDETYPILTFPNLTLPHLTRLVIGKGYFLTSFEQLARFSKLEQLAMNLIDDESGDRVHELDDLASLSALRDLEVSDLDVYYWQNVQRLTALTSLRLLELSEYEFDGDEGESEFAILPTAPMPRLRELHMVFGMASFAFDLYSRHKSDGAIDWVLRNGATTFPGVETMRLGVLQFPAPLDTELFTVHLAAHLMDTRVHDLLATAPNLKYLSIDQARVQEAGELGAAIDSGELESTLEEEIAIRTGGSRSVKWQREVQFRIIMDGRRTVRAKFVYTRMLEW